MKIQFMQNGGGMPPFTYYQPVAINTQQPQQVASQTSSTSDATEKGKLTDKDMLEMLGKIDGLPNDMNLVYNMMSNFFREKELGISVSSLSTTYLRALQSLKEAKFNKEQFDAAFKHAQKNGSLSEIAITDSGQVVVTDGTTKFKFISPEEYLKDKDKYKYYTNQDLLLMRQQDPTLAYQNNVFNVVNTAISSQKLGEMIDGFMYNLGSIEHSTEGYTRIKEKQIEEGLRYLQNAATQAQSQDIISGMNIDGFYKNKILTKSQAQSAQKALQYIYQALPENAKTLIKLKSDGTTKGVINYISDYVLGQVDDKVQFDVDMVEDAEGKKPGSNSSASGDKTHDDLYQNIVKGTGGTYTTFNMMNADGMTYQIGATAYPNFTNKVIDPQGSLADLLADTKLQGITKGNGYAITFGNKVLDANDMNNVVYMSDQEAVRTILPVTKDPLTGQIVPDQEFIAEHADLIKLINSKQGNMKDPEVQKKLIEAGIVDPYTGQLDMSRFQSYLCINGLISDENISDTSAVTEITGNTLDQYIDMFENALYKKKSEGDQGREHKVNFDRNTWYNPADWFGMHNSLYKGTIYIPLTENTLQAGFAAGTNFNQEQSQNLESIYQVGEAAKNMRPTSSNLLGL